MTARTYTVAFEGVEARLVEVQCAVSAGAPAFSLVGLPDKAVSRRASVFAPPFRPSPSRFRRSGSP